jgi:uncharacterized membrane protein
MRRRLDLAVVASVAVVCAAGVLVEPLPVAVSLMLALPLVLVLPGYALVEALGRRRPLDFAPRLVLVPALSIAADVLLGLVLNLSPFAITNRSWAVGLASVVCVACLVAHLHRRPRAALPPVSRRLRLRLADVAALVAAAVVVAVAVALARTPLSAERAQGYALLWLAPARGARTVSVGIQSGELRPADYRVVVTAGPRVVYSREGLRLAPGQRALLRVRLPDTPSARSTRVAARLYRSGDRHVYRHAQVELRTRPRG